MGLFSDIKDGWAQWVAPVTLPVGGGLIGGPGGVAAGSSLAGMLQPKDNSEQAFLREQQERNIQMQREFAQQGLRWRVEDAKQAGLHPLAALGSPGASFSPVQIGSVSEPSKREEFASFGQNLGRAFHATSTQNERQMTALQVQSAQLDIEGKALDNQIKNSQLRQMNNVGPAFPGSQSFISGQGNSGSPITEKPLERTRSLPGAPHSEPGAVPDVGWVKTPTGLVPVPSKDAKERTEDVMPHEWMHYYRNNVTPNWGAGPKPPKEALPKGAIGWKWNHGQQEYQPKYPPKDKPAKRDYMKYRSQTVF